MTGGTRRGAIALAVVTGALVAGLIAADRRDRPLTAIAIAPTSRPAPGGLRSVEVDGADRIPARGDRVAIDATARTFLRAYLPYTHGNQDALQGLPERTATPMLLATLDAASPHTPQGARPGSDRVSRVLAERLDRTHATALAEIQGPHASYAIAMTLHRTASGWQITDLHPAG